MLDYIVMIDRERDIIMFDDESAAYGFVYSMVVNYELEDVIDAEGFINKHLKQSPTSEDEKFLYIELSKIRKINKIAIMLIEEILEERKAGRYA